MRNKPLYIDSSSPTHVSLDGPSLCITQPATARRRYPLRRISRVVSNGQVQWAQEALVALVDQGIVVTFSSGNGTHGFVMPAVAPTTPPSQRLAEFLSRRDWKSLYTDWLRAYERREILSVLRWLRIRARDLRSAYVLEAIESHLARFAPLPLCRKFKQHLDSLLVALVNQTLADQDLAPSVLVDRRPGFHFPGDAARVLNWRLYVDIHRYFDRGSPFPKAPSSATWRLRMTSLFEASASRERRRILRYLDAFWFWLGGLS